MSDMEDELFDDEFTGDWTPLDFFEHPPIEQIPAAGMDMIGRKLGIDLTDAELENGRKLAAVEWFYRRAAGQRVTFRQVYRGGNGIRGLIGADVEAEASTVDPPSPPNADEPG